MIRWISLLAILVLATGCRSEANEAGSTVEAGSSTIEAGSSTIEAGSSIRPGGSFGSGSATIEAGSSTFRPSGLPIPGVRARLPELREPPPVATWDPAQGNFPPHVVTLLALRKDLEKVKRQLNELRNQQDPLSEQHRQASRALAGRVELSRELTEEGTVYTTARIDRAGDEFGKSIPELKKLDNLRTIVLRINNLKEDDEPLTDELSLLAQLPDLRELRFKYCKISPQGYEHLGDLGQLREISFNNCPIDDQNLAFLPDLPQLRAVHLRTPAGGKITDAGMSHLASLSKLESVVLNNLDISDEGIAFLNECEHLRRLTISSQSVTEDRLADLLNKGGRSNLEVLEIYLGEITDAFPSRLGTLPALRRLSIGPNQLTNRGIEAFQFKASPHLEELEIARSANKTPPTGECLQYLATNRALRELRLELDELSPDNLRYIARCRELRILSLGKLTLDRTAISYLSQLPHLEELTVEQVELSYADRGTLQYLPRVQTVWIGGLDVKNNELLALQALPSLRKLGFWGDHGTPSDEVRSRLAHVQLQIFE